jgi:hypothetical protein
MEGSEYEQNAFRENNVATKDDALTSQLAPLNIRR